MNPFEKLLVNSTNRLSAVENINLSQGTSSFTPLEPSDQSQCTRTKNSSRLGSCNHQETTETFQQLQQKYEQLSKIVSQANHQKQMMSKLFDKIFKIQKGEEETLKKRFRRKKSQIQSKSQCRIPKCNKIYSSPTSLARHTKLKHAYSKFQPPQHNYQIPPQPNLGQSSQMDKTDETKSNLKCTIQDKEGGEYNEDASNYDCQEHSCPSNSQSSEQIQVQKQPS